LSVHIKKI